MSLPRVVARSWPFVVVAVGAGVVFAWLCDAVGEHDGVTAVDGPVAAWFAAHRTAAEARAGLLLASLTSPALLVAVTVVAAAWLWRRGRRTAAMTVTAAVAVSYLAGAVAKLGEHRARPGAPVNLAPESEPSFPSGHVLVLTVLVLVALGLAWRHMSGGGRLLAAAGAVLVLAVVALDRLVVGAHWLTDVAGSVALASTIAAVALLGSRLMSRSPGPR